MKALTQTEKVLRYLKHGGKLTVLKALRMFGVYALSQRVGDINRTRKRKVKAVWKNLRNGKRVKEYSLS